MGRSNDQSKTSLFQTIVIVFFAGAILVLGLFVPKTEPNSCIERLTLGWGATIAQNCDSPNIALTANNLMDYLTKPSFWRSRPIYIFSLRATKEILSPVLTPLSHLILSKYPEIAASRYVNHNVDWLSIYLASIVFNVLVLCAACAAFIWVVEADSFLVRLGICGVVVSCDVAMAWFWVPHQIVMNVLVPVAGVGAFVLGSRIRDLSKLQIVAFGFLSGIASLVYGSCVIWPVLFGLGSLAYAWKWTWRGFTELASGLSIAAGAFLVPLLIWFGPYAAAGMSLSHEADLGQFAWLYYSWKEGSLGASVWEEAEELVVIVGGYLGLYGLILTLVFLTVGVVIMMQQGARKVLTDPVVVGAVVTTAVMFIFNFLQGFHPARLLLFPILLLAIVVLRLLSMPKWEKSQIAFCAAIIAVQLTMLLSNPAVSQQ